VKLTMENAIPSDRPDILKWTSAFEWVGVPRQQYKATGPHWAGVSRTELVAPPSSPEMPFHLRYFEIEPGGFSSKERHAHEHVVIVARGRGTVELDGASKEIVPGDVVWVRSWQLHQFRHAGDAEPLGFYCIVSADRDRPVVEGDGGSACEWNADAAEAASARSGP
jgi:quercetin dioxygenase-like cupin family protein